jgi:ADP-heptose:LPS heptosyltransferase
VDHILPTSGLDAPLSRVADRPDVAINMHGTGPRSHQLLDALHPARRIGWPGPRWSPEPHEREHWCHLLQAHGIPADATDLKLRKPDLRAELPGVVVVHPGAAYGSKRWPPSRFGHIAATLRRDGHQVVITATAAEQPIAQAVAEKSRARVVRTSLPQLAALIAHAALVISGDTGVAHLAYAFGTPSVTLFGPVAAARWGPPERGPHKALSRDSHRVGDAFAGTPDPALLAVSETDVLAASRCLLLQGRSGRDYLSATWEYLRRR